MSRLIAYFLLLLPLSALAAPVEIRGARLWIAPDQTQLVIDADAPIEHKIFPVSAPDRLIIDIPEGRVTGKLPLAEPEDRLVKGVRSGVLENGQLRIVIDLKQGVRAKSFVLEPNERYGHRLVVDMAPKSVVLPAAGASPATAAKPAGHGPRDLIVAIDAGHGGEDPGAIGVNGTLEKDITLAIARKLANLINRETGMRAQLVRDGDYYLGLYKRIELGRQYDADLFVSIHADANQQDQDASGSSVFVLSKDGATSAQAKWLAEKENNADRIGGVNAVDKAPELSKILWEMSKSGTMEFSNLAAQAVLTNLSQVGVVHHGKVQKAGFAVLKAPDIPSMLVETAFITNPEEEKRLNSPDYQAKLAGAMMEGIKEYFANHPPPGTRWASKGGGRQHVIGKGDTLGRIAKQYAVSVSSLRSLNRLEDGSLRVGQVLIIPEG
ncbi:MAG: N-acetylmuramoyl-L-alanine amidase [Chromatiaceae bacterium]|nr:N-acetylmuramoyl-L-alanine amidase [Chromatiaceae bacterium]